MSELKMKGIIKEILAKENGTSKAGKEWVKQSFVLDNGDQYNPIVCFGMFGDDKVSLLSKFKAGDTVTVDFNLSSREFNGKYYTQADAWKLWKDTNESEDSQPSQPADLSNDDEDGLPF